MDKSKQIIASAILILTSFFVACCSDTEESWIEGKWHTEVFGASIEYDLRPNGEMWLRPLGGDVFGEEVEEEAEASKGGTWLFDGKILRTTDETESTESVITRTEKGFVMQPSGSPIALSFKRP